MIIDPTDCVVENNCFPRRENLDFNCNHVENLFRDHGRGVAFHPHRGIRNLSPYQIIPIIRARMAGDFSAQTNWVQTRLPLTFYPKSGESLSLRVSSSVTRQRFALNFWMICASAKRGHCRDFFTLCDFQHAGYNHDTNLSHFPGLNRYHQVGNHPGS